MRHIENIVIGNPLIDPSELFALNENDWLGVEKEKTYYTNERFLPKILVELGVYPSLNEIRRNRPDLVRNLDKPDFIEIKPKKKVYLWVQIGE